MRMSRPVRRRLPHDSTRLATTENNHAGRPRAQIAVVSNVLPHTAVPHAGGQYMLRINEAWDELGVDYVYLVPDYPTNRMASLEEGAPPCLLLGASDSRLQGVLRKLTDMVRRFDPGFPDLAMARDLLRGPAREHLANASCVDLQWMESIRLAPVVKRVNSKARLVGTFHDVLSQRFDRAARESKTSRSRFKWRVAARLERRAQHHAVTRLDTSVVFAQKDADLIGNPGNARVIVPPMASQHSLQHVPQHPPTVIFVAYLRRPENLDAVEWLVHDIWPSVRSEQPDAVLRIVGGGPVDQLREQYGSHEGVTFSGYVADLAPEYAAASACIIPLRLGAGVKFKVIEAMAAGVPVITTTVGAEGIGTRDYYVALTNEPEELAAGICKALADPFRAHLQAAPHAEWAQSEFGMTPFIQAVSDTYR